jgi:O-antigen ligase
VDKVAFNIYLITLVVSPLLFGAVHTYAYTIMSLGVLLGGLFLVIKNTAKDLKTKRYKVQLPQTSLNVTFIFFLAFLFFQVIPLPDVLLEFVSPEAMVVSQKSLPASTPFISEIPVSKWFSLSAYYYPVRMSIIRWTVYMLFFLGLTQVLNSQRRIELAIFLILITACFEALYGLAEAYSGSGHIWWFKKMAHGVDVTGTYINRNHLAGLMEMCLLLAASYAGALSTREKRREIISERKASLKGRLARFLSGEQRFNKRTLILFAGAVIGIGLVFSASRGGMISAAGAMLCMSLFFIFRKNHRRKGCIILFLFLITSAYALYIGAEYPIGRFQYFYTDIKARARFAQKTMDMFDDYKATGIGIGNFQYGYPKYQASEDKNVFIRHAHNDWAQFLAEAGIIGFCIFLIGLFYYVYQTLQLWRKRTDPFAVCLGVVPFPVIIAMMIHSYSDFNLHIPANCLILIAIMAIGYSALHLTRHRGRDRTLYRYHTMPLKYNGIVALFVVLGLITWTGIWAARHFMAEAYCNTVTNSTLNRDQNPPVEEIKRAIKNDRWNAEYWYKLARKLRKIRDSKMENLGADNEDRYRNQMEIIEAMEEAVQLNPLSAGYHVKLGWEYTYLWKDPSYCNKWLLAADVSMERAAYFVGEKNPSLHVHLGNYWTFRSKTINPAEPEWETAWNKACWHYKRAQSLEKSKSLVGNIANYVWKYYPDKKFISMVLLTEDKSFSDLVK